MNTASKYSQITDSQKKAFLTQALDLNLSVRAIAELCDTYPNKVRRDAKKLGCETPDKSKAQKAALASGRHKHPTKGTKRGVDTKVKISEKMADVWENLDESEKKRRSKLAAKQWKAKSPDELREFREKAGTKIREAAINGSKLERFLMHEMIRAGYEVEFHKEHLIQNERLQMDLYLPKLKVAIEVDGPSHFRPIWGEEALAKSMIADANKNGLVLSMGLCLIRVRQRKALTEKYKRDLWNELSESLLAIKADFPPSEERYIELGD
tara:strand:- start:165 stop:965 length:801 start_codon:yes stop_codon:yes gene_type:complete